MKPTICLDFDGVIHSYTTGWQGIDIITDPVVPGTKDAIAKLRKQYTVVIHSVRCKETRGKEAIVKFLANNGITVDGVVTEKPMAEFYIDDRAIPFDGRWRRLFRKIKKFNWWINSEERKLESGFNKKFKWWLDKQKQAGAITDDMLKDKKFKNLLKAAFRGSGKWSQ